MAKPRVFVSSTYYDLKHLRSSIENFIDLLGYDPILSEKGDIAFVPDIPLDESCYREVGNADVFVLIVGGRYGSEKSEGRRDLPKSFYDKYESITRQEYKNAIDKDIPIYILIEKSVYADFETFLKNKSNTTINYAHVDSINIFSLIEDIISQLRNNPIYLFDKYSEIETWLKEQWAGLFKELLQRRKEQQQLSSLSNQVSELSEINITLKTYLEQVVSKIDPTESVKLIKSETKRLEEARKQTTIFSNPLMSFLRKSIDSIEDTELVEILENATSYEDFFNRVISKSGDTNFKERCKRFLALDERNAHVLNDLNAARLMVNKATFQRPTDKKIVKSKSTGKKATSNIKVSKRKVFK